MLNEKKTTGFTCTDNTPLFVGDVFEFKSILGIDRKTIPEKCSFTVIEKKDRLAFKSEKGVEMWLLPRDNFNINKF